jgi:hypothetical protein
LLDVTLDAITDMSDGLQNIYVGKLDIERGPRPKAIAKI